MNAQPTDLPRHYLRLVPNLRDYVMQVDLAVDNWQRELFDDLTEVGKKLTIERLPRNERGERLGLCGEKYYCEAGVDRARTDCLFVFRVDSASRRQLKSIPRRYPAQLYLLDSRTAPPLDNVSCLWSDGRREAVPTAVHREVSFDPHLSDDCLNLVMRADKELRTVWRPYTPADEPESIATIIDRVSRCWIKFDLGRYRPLTPRQDSLIKKLIPTKALGDAEQQLLLSAFDVNLLNSYVRDNKSRATSVFDLLRAIGELPVPSTLRAAIWAAMTQSLTADEFLRELHDTASTFEALELGDDAKPWTKNVLEILMARNAKPGNELLQHLLDDIKDQQYPLSFIHLWANENLEFEDLRSGHQKSDLMVPAGKAAVEHPSELASTELPVNKATFDPTVKQRSTQFEEWVLSLQALEPEQARMAAKEVYDRLSSILKEVRESKTLSDVVELSRLIGQLQADVPGWASLLPEPVRWSKDYEMATKAYDAARDAIGNELDPLLATTRFTPNDLEEATSLLHRKNILLVLPTWVWGDEPGVTELSTNPAVTMFRNLLVPQVRERVKLILNCAEEIGNRDASLVSTLPPPPHGDGSEITAAILDQHIRSWFTATRELLNELPATLVPHLADYAQSTTLNAKLRQAVGLYRKIRGRVSHSVCDQILATLISAHNEEAAIRLSELYGAAIDFCEREFGTATDSTFAMLQGRVDKDQRLSPGLSPKVAVAGSELRIEHNWIDAQGSKVPLLFTPSNDSTRPYGYVSAPFVLISRQRRPCSLKFSYEVKTGHRDAWPGDWENPEPNDLILAEDDWRDDADQPDQYLHTVKIRIPIRRQGRGERFEFQVDIKDSENGYAVGKPTRFSWDIIRDAPQTSVLPQWPEIIDPKNVEDHPIGPQKKSREILSRLAQSGSFCVTAPRRFGKSTLVQFLQEKARASGFIVPPAVVCTNYYASGQGTDYVKLWLDVSDNLQKQLGAAITRPWDIGVPGEEAFDHVRRAAQQKGKKGIVILLDEAQIFFPMKAGIALGDIVKDRIERHWSAKKPGMAPVMFGFIGLPLLQERAGVNLIGLLRPLAQNDLQEEELNRLILGVTSNVLNTTREARRRLARTAGNIYILRTLVDHLAEHVQHDGRTWVSFDDVANVETILRTSLREGEEAVLPTYIRDVLNDAEDISDWKPNAAMPLAIAIADVKHKTSANRLYDEARLRLDSWYESVSSNNTTRLSYDDQQFREHLRILEGRGIVRNREFTSCLLEDWLLGYKKQVDDQEWRELLRSAAIKRIKIPGSMQKVPDAEGGEASVWVSVREGVKYAYRITQLRTEGDRARFTETREILENLRNRLADGGTGSQFVFRLAEVGLSADTDNEAVQVYKWVEGIDLSRRVEGLRGAYVADLGGKLAQALHFLHSSNIVHRDISPRNIVLTEEGGDPVVIDFGFARRLTPDVKTCFDNDYSAPEVRRSNAKWTKAADVYSLGSTLLKLIEPRDTCKPLRDLLRRCLDQEADGRPDATQLIPMFQEVIKELHVDLRKEHVWESVRQAAADDLVNHSWLRGLLDKFKGNFIGVALGCYPSQFDRCREAANFLNQVLEATSARGPNRLSLGMVKDDNHITADKLASEAIRFMHSVRRYDSHGEYRARERLTAKFGKPRDEQMLALGLEAASQIASYVQCKSVSTLASFLMSGLDEERPKTPVN